MKHSKLLTLLAVAATMVLASCVTERTPSSKLTSSDKSSTSKSSKSSSSKSSTSKSSVTDSASEAEQSTDSAESTPSTVDTTEDEISVTYTLTDLPNWLRNADCVVFAHPWTNGEGYGYIALEFSEAGDTATFTIDHDDVVGMILVRCAAGTEASGVNAPDYDAAEDYHGAGRVYNQTSDIAVNWQVQTYSAPETIWSEYHKSAS